MNSERDTESSQLPLIEIEGIRQSQAKPAPRAQRKTSASRAPRKENAGEALERRVGRLEFAEGALVRLRLPVRIDADAGRDILTDLDVVAIDVDSRLRVSTSILECKSGAGQSGEPDRLLWLAGLRDFVGDVRAVLVRTSVSSRGRLMARRLSIEAIDVPQIASRELAIAWVPEYFAHLGGAECTLAEKRADEQFKQIGSLPSDLVAFIRGDSLLSPHRTLGALVDLRLILDDVSLPAPASFILGGHALVSLLHTALVDAQTLDSLPREALGARLEQALTVGIGNHNLLQVLDQADALVDHAIDRIHDAYESTGVSRQKVARPRLREIVAETPSWIPRYLDMIEAFRANSTVARELLQTAELACFEALPGGSAHEYQAFDHLFTVEHRQLLRLALIVLEEVAGSAVSSPLQDFKRLRFDRIAPTVPDRRSAPTKSNS